MPYWFFKKVSIVKRCQNHAWPSGRGTPYVAWVDIAWLQMCIDLLPKCTLRILPDLPIFSSKPTLLLGQPVCLVRPSLRDEVDFKAGFAEDVVRMQSLGHEHSYLDPQRAVTVTSGGEWDPYQSLDPQGRAGHVQM